MKNCFQWQHRATLRMTASTCQQVSAKRTFLLLTCCKHSQPSASQLVSVGVSALGQTSIHFVDPGIKINGQYYRDVLLQRDLLPEIRQLSDFYIFQQDSAPAHRAQETVWLLKRETPDFISPSLWTPNSPDLNPVDYKIWGVMQERVYEKKIRDAGELQEHIIEAWERLSLTLPPDSGGVD